MVINGIVYRDLFEKNIKSLKDNALKNKVKNR
jgi:hypothetical protein